MSYLLQTPTAKKTPQSKPIPGREREMTRNSAGGFAFTADSFTRMERFLILGSEGGTYYVGEADLTKQNIDNMRACIAKDGARAVKMIVDISLSGRAPKNDPALYALALASSFNDEAVRREALAALPLVARTGTHLFQFCAFVDSMRGWGLRLREAVARWYHQKTPVEKLGYQLVKYQQRNGWSHRDVFRLVHVSNMNEAIYRWVITGSAGIVLPRTIPAMPKKGQAERVYPAAVGLLPAVIVAFENGKGADEATIISLIREHGLTREMIPTEHQKSPAVWEALLHKMPTMAMIRTLGRMSASGLLAPFSDASKVVVERLENRQLLREARVHPIAVLTALMTYKQGRGVKGSLTWTPVPQIVDALDAAFYMAFDNVKSTGKNFCLGIDVSSSMAFGQVAGVPGLTPNAGAAAMAMLIARTEPNHFIGGFATRFVDLGITKSDRLDTACAKAQRDFGGTDCAVAINHALANRYPVDAFVIITDGETWAGETHASQAIVKYRQNAGRDAKLIVINMTANRPTLNDPADAGSLDVVGFDSAVPTLINGFIGAKAEAHQEEPE